MAHSHDASLCLLKDDEVRFALAVERPMRAKRGISVVNPRLTQKIIGTAWSDAIRHCLKTEGIRFEQIDYFSGVSPDVDYGEGDRLTHSVLPHLERERIVDVPHPAHHLAHALASFYPSGFATAAGLVIDCYGSIMGPVREAQTGFLLRRGGPHTTVFRELKRRQLAGMRRPDGKWLVPEVLEGVGEVYRIISLCLGFWQPSTIYDEAGKTMGLAPYGKPIEPRGGLLMQLDGYRVDCRPATEFLKSRGLLTQERDGWLLSVRPPTTPLSADDAALAAQVQLELEDVCLGLARALRRETGERRLVLGGGVFLNSVANNRIREESGFDEVYIFPAATDDGTSVGAAYAALEQVAPRAIRPCARPLRSAALGQAYTVDDVRRAIADAAMPATEYDSAAAAAAAAAALIAEGEILGWFQGRAEFGPRALGHRSILANPAVATMKDIVNARVKFREAFRPYAPAVPEEDAGEYFDLPVSSPFMLLVCQVRPGYRDALPAITHVDGTARVQTVTASEDPLFHHLLKCVGAITGIPMVLNTSLNTNNEPIVDTPADALRVLLGSDLDAVVIDRFIVRPKAVAAIGVSVIVDYDRPAALDGVEREVVAAAGPGATIGEITATTGIRTSECTTVLRRLLRRGAVRLH